MLKAFNLHEIFWDYDIIVTIDMPSLGYYSALGLYSAGKSMRNWMCRIVFLLKKSLALFECCHPVVLGIEFLNPDRLDDVFLGGDFRNAVGEESLTHLNFDRTTSLVNGDQSA